MQKTYQLMVLLDVDWGSYAEDGSEINRLIEEGVKLVASDSNACLDATAEVVDVEEPEETIEASMARSLEENHPFGSKYQGGANHEQTS